MKEMKTQELICTDGTNRIQMFLECVDCGRETIMTITFSKPTTKESKEKEK